MNGAAFRRQAAKGFPRSYEFAPSLAPALGSSRPESRASANQQAEPLAVIGAVTKMPFRKRPR